ncbi:uncharacterized protein LOC126565519 [Anopheles maculipalpis]|uniref:uncharacterized protein LOC126565519 n=1 Tax=Anopheles maculipalpis TaxID=1496333 RepID=UPI0021591798|nr:uncharacterized protein LOC126565519 [Anopheles maculipalpis]
MESDDKSEIKIKEKLNLHVKKRLQETAKEGSHDKHDSKEKSSATAGTTNAPGATRPKRQKTKNGSKCTPNASTPGVVGSIPPAGVRPSDFLLSPGAANSNDTTNSSINSTDQDGELNDRDACDRVDKPAKSNQRMDIFAMILNQKKSSLMCDPEVIQLMKTLTESKK